jgi:hypothetical protein
MSWFNQLPKSSDSKDIEHADNPVIKPSEFMNTAFKGN